MQIEANFVYVQEVNCCRRRRRLIREKANKLAPKTTFQCKTLAMTRSRRSRLWQLTLLLIKMIFRHFQVPTWHRRNSTRHQHAISTFSSSLPSVAPWMEILELFITLYWLSRFLFECCFLELAVSRFRVNFRMFFFLISHQSFKVEKLRTKFVQ